MDEQPNCPKCKEYKFECKCKKVIGWWSGGITSAVACKLSIEKYGTENCRIIMLDTQNEHDDTYRFLKDCEKWYQLPIKLLRSKKYKNIQETWYRNVSLNSASGAVCSTMLKRRVRELWQKTNEWKHQVFGFEFDKTEIKRAKSMELNHPRTKPIFPLIENQLSKKDCIKIVLDAGIRVPKSYSLGFNNNNCLKTGCVQGGIGYWKKIKRMEPKIFDAMAKVEHELTNIKGKPVTMLKDQTKQAIKSGFKLVFLKKHPDFPEYKCIDEMRGHRLKPLIDCNSFCGINDLLKNNKTQEELNFTEEEDE